MLIETQHLDGHAPESIAAASELIRAGRLVAFPTETVYGLGADALNPAAVRRIFEAKARPAEDPIIVHIADLDRLPQLTAGTSELALRLAEYFWPGPLTLVIPRSNLIPDEITAGGPTVAVRMPDHPIALSLIRAAGTPIGAPSANRFSETSPTTAEHVRVGLGGRIEMILDGGPTAVGVESTVLDLSQSRPRILRPGGVTAEMLGEVLPDLDASTVPSEKPSILLSPGMLDRHYAPKTPLWLFDGAPQEIYEKMGAALDRIESSGSVGLMIAEEDLTFWERQTHSIHLLGSLLDLPGIAQSLYRVLREADSAGSTHIFARTVPATGIGVAIRDRLRRAADRII